MKYIGPVKNANGHLIMPDSFSQAKRESEYDAVEFDGMILLSARSLDRKRIEKIRELTNRTITRHRKTLDGLAK